MRYIVATDGACKGNPGPGTWAFVVFDTKTEKMLGHKKGHKLSSTNNEMELTAIVQAMAWAEKHKDTIDILTDSFYCYNGLNTWLEGWVKNGWKTAAGGDVKNIELWKKLNDNNCVYTIKKVKGHSGNKFNEAADMYCNEEYINVFI
jgi:ribonuclease HI